jgi:DNA-binding FadR family transcriptional regulator
MSTAAGTSTRVSRAEQVALQLEDEILESRLPVGAHLGRRAEMMDRFGVSPTVMNELLRILRTRGLVTVRPGTGGGIFVASQPPQVRLGGMDLWFDDSRSSPLDLFEARVHLENSLNELAFERATDDDLVAMDRALAAMQDAADARAFLGGVMELHRALARASRVLVLDDMHQTIVALLLASLSRASYIDGHEPLVAASVAVHREMVAALRASDSAAYADVMSRHHESLVRADDPRRSPVRVSSS